MTVPGPLAVPHRWAEVPTSAPLRRAIVVALGLLAVSGCAEPTQSATSPAPTVRARPVHASVDDLQFATGGALWAISAGAVRGVKDSGQLTSTRGARASSGALSPGATRVIAFDDAGDRVSLRPRSGGRARWTAATHPPQYETPRAFWAPDASTVLLDTTDAPIRLLNARTGHRLLSLKPSAYYLGRQPLSPDGKSMVLRNQNGALILDTNSGKRRSLTADGALDRPVWSPDGRRIAGASPTGAITIIDIDSGAIRHLQSRAGVELAWSPDSQQLAAYGVPMTADDELGVATVDIATDQTTIIANSGASQERGELAWSPDGRQLAYQQPPSIPCAPETGGGQC